MEEITTATIKSDNYRFTLELKNSNKITLEYNEATLWECLEFIEVIESQDFSLIEYTFNFLITYGDKKITKKEFQENIILSFNDFLEEIKASRFNGIFRKGEKKIQEDGEVPDPKATFLLFKRQIAKMTSFLSLKMSLHPKAVMKEYTWNEATYWLDWYLYWLREETEDGRKENRSIETSLDIKANKEQYDKEFEKLDLYLKKQNQGKKS